MNINNLRGIIPDNILQQIPFIVETFKINTPLRLSHFLSQCMHESGNFKFLVENLNYSENGLLSTFPKYFSSGGASQYARKPEKIANRVYANRMGNGNEWSGDGWKYRGRGYIQLTGKANYALFAQAVREDVVTYPDLVATKYPLASAAWFFHRNALNTIADKGPSVDVITAVTRRINGGTKGLNDRISKFNQIYPLLLRP